MGIVRGGPPAPYHNAALLQGRRRARARVLLQVRGLESASRDYVELMKSGAGVRRRAAGGAGRAGAVRGRGGARTAHLYLVDCMGAVCWR